MQKVNLIIYIAILFIYSSCNNQKENYINSVRIELKKLDDLLLDKYSYVVIIPGSGCSGCITEAESFYMRNKENKNIFFVFTDILSIKSIKLKVGKDVIERKNVFFDKNDVFLSNDYNENIYLLIFNIKEKENINYHFLNPDEKLTF